MLLDQKIEPIIKEEEFNRRAEEIYRTNYQKKLESDKSLKGKIAAIEDESGNCFIGSIPYFVEVLFTDSDTALLGMELIKLPHSI